MNGAYENSIYSQRSKNILRTWMIIVGFFAVIVSIGYVFATVYQDVSLLVVAFVGALFGNVSSYFFSDKIALSSSGATKADPKNPRDLRLIRMVENMSITAGMETPRVYIINDPAPNAFATGRNEKNAAVAFTTGILELLEDSELEGVVAHELSHVKNRDILVGTIVVIMVGFIAILAELFLRMGVHGNRSSREGGSAAGVLVIVGVIFVILAPIASRLIQFAVSRKREYLADASGALLTRYPEGLANALVKISAHARPLAKSSAATSHLFIANPFGPSSKKRSFIENLFSTHPPMEKRVEALLGSQGQELINEHRQASNIHPHE